MHWVQMVGSWHASKHMVKVVVQSKQSSADDEVVAASKNAITKRIVSDFIWNIIDTWIGLLSLGYVAFHYLSLEKYIF